MTKYFEVSGNLKKAIIAILDRMTVAKRKMMDLAKRHGSPGGIFISESFMVQFAIEDGPSVDKKLWKSIKGDKRQMRPRLSSKAGKELEKEMREIEQAYEGKWAIAKLIDMDVVSGGHWRLPGLFSSEGLKRVVVVTDETYDPPKKLAGQIKRISDIDAESMGKNARKRA